MRAAISPGKPASKRIKIMSQRMKPLTVGELIAKLQMRKPETEVWISAICVEHERKLLEERSNMDYDPSLDYDWRGLAEIDCWKTATDREDAPFVLKFGGDSIGNG
jgi:hypothetical protein